MPFPDRLDLTVKMDLHDSDDVPEFDGTTSDYIIDSSWTVWGTATKWTFEFWCKVDTLQNSTTLLNILRNSDNAVCLRVATGPDIGLSLDITDSVGYQFWPGVADGEHHHVALTMENDPVYGNVLRYFIDGVLRGQSGSTQTPPIGTAQLLLGQKRTTIAGAMTQSMEGLIYDFRFWDNVKRTRLQIIDNMQERLAGSESGLETYWKLDEGTGTTANDSTASNQDGTLANSGMWGTSAITRFFTDVTANIDPASKPFKWSSVLGSAVDTAGFSLQEWEGVKPEEWDEVIILDGTTRIFGGFATQVITSHGADVKKDFYVGCSDYGIYLDHVLHKEERENTADDNIIRDLMRFNVPWINAWDDAFSSGLYADWAGEVHRLQTYTLIRFNFESIRQIIDGLAASAGANWYVDPYRNLHYFSGDGENAAYNLSSSPNLSTTFPFYGMVRQEGGAKLVNYVDVIGGHYPSNDEELIFAGTGEHKRIIMPFRMLRALYETNLRIYRNDASPGRNLLKNPSFEPDVSTHWTFYQDGSGGNRSRDNEHTIYSSFACKLKAGTDRVALYTNHDTNPLNVEPGQTLYFSAYIWSPTADIVRLRMYDRTNLTWRKTGEYGGGGSGWVRMVLKWTSNQPTTVNMNCYVENHADDNATNIWIDACVATIGQEYVPGYVDGDQPDCVWEGTAHDSESYREDGAVPIWTELNLIDQYTESFDDFDDVAHYYEDRVLEAKTNWPNLQNAVKVFGRYEIPLRSRYKDQASFDFYGRWFMDRIVDTTIVDKQVAKLKAKALVAERSMGTTSITCHVREPGLVSGTKITVTNTQLGITSQDFIIQRVDASINVYGKVMYALALGVWNDDLIDLLLRIVRRVEPPVPWQDNEALDELLQTSETLTLAETTYAPTADQGPYVWNTDDWDFMDWG